MSHATTNYISFLNCLYRVGFLCKLLFDINWFILEYFIINCIGKCLQVLICLVKLFASIFLSLFIVFVLSFFLCHFGEYRWINDYTGLVIATIPSYSSPCYWWLVISWPRWTPWRWWRGWRRGECRVGAGTRRSILSTKSFIRCVSLPASSRYCAPVLLTYLLTHCLTV